MTIRRRLALTFFAILVLFALNLVVYFWGKHLQSNAVNALRHAISSQLLVASIHENIGTIQKELAVLSEVAPVAAKSGAAPQESTQFVRRLEGIQKQIEDLAGVSDSQSLTQVESLRRDYQRLSDSWQTFYRNFGVNQSKAIVALATEADPLSQRLVSEALPRLREQESHRVESASLNFDEVGRWTDRISLAIFLISALLALWVGYRLSRHLTSGLDQLKTGTTLVGQGQLDHRIEVHTNDELGDLAHAYNSMAEYLQKARTQLTRVHEEMERRNLELDQQRGNSEKLLLNILPIQVARELQEKGKVEPKYFEDVTIIFTDFVGFTLSTEKLAAEELVRILNDYFTRFDEIVARYYLEKLKTIGDSYMYVGGLPLGRRARRTPSHPVDAVMAALEMVRVVAENDHPNNRVRWAVRVGIHTGPVVAGVVGIQKFAFDVWGDSVNFASRMESSGAANRINLSPQTYSRVKDFFECEYRGKVLTKDKRESDMYFVNGLLPSLHDASGQIPPDQFLRRYRVYFQKEPPAFPAFLLGNGYQQHAVDRAAV